MQEKQLAEFEYFSSVLKNKPGMQRAQQLPSWKILWSMDLDD